MANDIRGWMGPTFSWYVLWLRKNPRKNLNQKIDPTGIEHRPSRWGNGVTPRSQLWSIVSVDCTREHRWRRGMVPCQLVSCPSKRQLSECTVSRSTVVVVTVIWMCASKLISQLEQWTNIKLCQKLGKTSTVKFQMLQQVYDDDALSRSVVFRWHRHFAQGQDSLEDVVHTSRPQAVRTEHKIQVVAMLVRANGSPTSQQQPWYTQVHKWLPEINKQYSPHIHVHTNKVCRQLASWLCCAWNANSGGYIG